MGKAATASVANTTFRRLGIVAGRLSGRVVMSLGGSADHQKRGLGRDRSSVRPAGEGVVIGRARSNMKGEAIMSTLRGAGVSLLAVLATAACSASSGPAGKAVGNAGGTSNGGTGSGAGGSVILGGTGGTGGTSGTGTIITGGTDSGTGGGDTCGVTSAKGMLVREPVDIIVILDNSGSMHEEMGAAESNINVNFASILDTNSVDYRVILLSRHRDGVRTTGETSANTSICVAAPLSGLATCPSEDPVFSERFFQYDLKVESDDSFDKALLWFDLVDDDDDALAPNGWGPWLRPTAKKVFIEMTDDNEDMTAAAFTAALTAKSPENFGTAQDPNFTFHSIVGIKEKANPTEAHLPTDPIEMAVCTGNGAVIENAGLTYQELSVATGGLRFPLCQFPGYDAVFRRIAEDVVVTSSIACSFPVPAPPQGTTLDPNKVAVSYTPGTGMDPVEFGQVLDPADCGDDAFHFSADGSTIELCAEACSSLQTALKDDPNGKVDVLFKCESTIIPPR
jgi:hypothetical protein